MQVTIDIPEGYFIHHDRNLIAQKVKLYTALLMFQSKQLSRGAACEFAGVNLYTFMEACQKHQISIMNYPTGEIEADLEKINRRKFQ
ncbi:MAG: UPF0175 family protein [Thiomargarita sp.]|nr:UPF0175 family protein [Thiomargarita sp.]